MDLTNQSIKILIAEDVPTDAELIRREINKSLLKVTYKVVETRTDFINAVNHFQPDLVITDYRMPTFDGMSALHIVLDLSPLTPVIVVTGSLNEEIAVNCLKSGAVDYVLKESLKRIGQAVLNALEQKLVKIQKNEAEIALIESEGRFRRLAENAVDLIYRIELSPVLKLSYMSLASFHFTGYSPEEHYNNTDLIYSQIHPEDKDKIISISKSVEEIRKPTIFRIIRKDGKVIWTEHRNIPIINDLGVVVALEGIARDITSYIEALETIKQSEKDYRALINGMTETVWIIGLDAELIDVNKAAIKILGYSREELLKIGLSSIDRNLNKEMIKQMAASLIHDKFQIFETEHTSKDGTIIPVEICSSLIKYRGISVVLSVARDITIRRTTEKNLKLLSRAIEQNPVTIVITNIKGNIEYVNPAFSRKSGYSAAEVIGKTPRILKSGHQPIEFYKEMWGKILSGKEWIGEFRNKHKNGEFYWEEAVISPITDKDGEITHFVAVKEDITEKKKMLEDLVAAKEKAEESDRLKSAFLANMSHEIRTPMNGILGFANLLKEPNLSGDEKQHFIDIIESSGQRMLNTINDLMDIAKIESGVVEVNYSTVLLEEVLQSLYYFFRPEASKKGLNLINPSTSELADINIVTDKEMLISILTNLIKNSIKYTYTGSIEFGYTVKAKSILFFVKDTGIGIDKSRQEAIFERFVQEDSSISRAFEGAGLGLSISRAYVEILGGKIWVESAKGEGSRFFFTIPDKNDNAGNIEPTELIMTLPDSGVFEDLTILIAEDDKVGQLFLTTILEKKCKKILYAENGEEAVELVQKFDNVDLILMDMKMPVMNGFVATQKIKSIKPEIFIIAQTAFAMTNDKEMALKAGCDAYITKPVNKDQLIKLIKDHFTA
jgi:PAS domain S-box-containing protein